MIMMDLKEIRNAIWTGSLAGHKTADPNRQPPALHNYKKSFFLANHAFSGRGEKEVWSRAAGP